MRRRMIALAVVAMAASAGTACTAEPAEPTSVSVGMPEPKLPTDPTVANLLWTPLIDYDFPTGKVTPRAAASVTPTDDQVTWTITLNPMTYGDGRPVTAQSYVDAWTRGKKVGAKEMTAPDPLTIHVVLNRPDSEWRTFLASTQALPFRPEDETLGDGPFRLTAPWQQGKGAHAVRVRDEPGKPKEFDLRVFDDMAVAYDQVKAGTLDVAVGVPGSRHTAMLADFATSHVMWSDGSVTVLAFDDGPSDPSARFAVSVALDRTDMAARLTDNQADPATGLLPPAIAPGDRSGTCRACTYDPAAAKSLADQSGLAAIRVPTTMSAQVRKVLNVDVTSGPEARLKTEGFTDPDNFLAYLHVPSIQQFLDTARSTGDFEARAQQYRLAENEILRDLPLTPLWFGHGHAVWGPRVKAVTATMLHGVELAPILTKKSE